HVRHRRPAGRRKAAGPRIVGQQARLVHIGCRTARDGPRSAGPRRRGRPVVGGGVPVLAGWADLRRYRPDPAQHHCRTRTRTAPGAAPMTFVLTPEQEAFAASLRDLLAAADTPHIAREWAAGRPDPGRKL